jgi:hypothetical protein
MLSNLGGKKESLFFFFLQICQNSSLEKFLPETTYELQEEGEGYNRLTWKKCRRL